MSIETSNRPAMAQEFINKVGATFTTVNDDHDVSEKVFGVTGTPTNLTVDESGRIFFRTLGFAPGHEKIYAAQIDYLLERSPKLGMLKP